MGRRLEPGHLAAFQRRLLEEEREAATIEKYLREVGVFAAWAGSEPVTKELACRWKERLAASGCQPATINGKLAALNKFFAFLGWIDCQVKYLKVQRRMFRSSGRELSRKDYTCLVETARELGRERLALLIETICATGKLCRKLVKYARKRKIASGEIFLTRSGKGLSRRQIWAEMKALCAKAGVERSKVFPHNLRHLFARSFYRACRDVVKLADVLGHSNIETTRIYLISTGAEHARQLERLGLVS